MFSKQSNNKKTTKKKNKTHIIINYAKSLKQEKNAILKTHKYEVTPIKKRIFNSTHLSESFIQTGEHYKISLKLSLYIILIYHIN